MNVLMSLRKSKVSAVIELSLIAAVAALVLIPLGLALRSHMPSSTVLGVRWVTAAHVPSTEVINGKTYHIESASAACSTSVTLGFGNGPGTRCLAERLAWDPRPGADAYVWVVALDPPGGKYVIYEGPGGSPFGPSSYVSDYNYAVYMMDVYTGKNVDGEAGYDPGVPPFPK